MDRERTPLIDDAGERMVRRLREHVDAPAWNYAVGDRLVAADLDAVAAFRHAPGSPASVLAWLAGRMPLIPRLRGLPLGTPWEELPTSCRAELAAAPWSFVPDDEPLDRLVIYRTAGTTGHPVEVPHHPRAVACYLPLLEAALGWHGVTIPTGPDVVAALLVGAQVKTYTYSTVLSAWAGSGFAKVNLRPTEWRTPGAPARYLRDLAAPLITGEPVAFSELLAMEAAITPAAMVSTSVALSPGLRDRLGMHFGCPVIDWYSMVETGPIAAACPGGWLHVLPNDLIVEVLAPAGDMGEIAVSGGRNPFLPLVRYRTGDRARLEHTPCPCGNPSPRLIDLEGRASVVFRACDGTPVGTVDVSRLLRAFPLTLHALRQRADRSIELRACPLPGSEIHPEALRAEMETLFGPLPLTVDLDLRLGADAKLIPWTSEVA
jgi:phenylacetate-CoA ligase